MFLSALWKIKSTSQQKGILSLLPVPGKLTLPEGRNKLPLPPFSSSELPFMSLELFPFPLNINPNFTRLSSEALLRVAVLKHNSGAFSQWYQAYLIASALADLTVLELKVTKFWISFDSAKKGTAWTTFLRPLSVMLSSEALGVEF